MKVEMLVRSASRNTRAPVAGEERAVSQETSPVQSFPRREAPREIGKIAAFPAPAPARPAPSAGPLFGSPLDSRFTFDTFVEGPSNRVALAAAKTIAEAGASAVRFHPLFIHSGVGLGKTHLLQAIANAAVGSDRMPRVVYLTAEYFMWRFATAIP